MPNRSATSTSYTLYVDPRSAPCRAVLLHLRLLGPLAPKTEIVEMRLASGDHMADDFRALNPMHCVPTLRTPWGVVWESRSIMQHLAEVAQVADPDAWVYYPRRAFQRARCNMLLDWDQGVFYRAISDCVYPVIFRGEEPKHEHLEAVNKAFAFLEKEMLPRSVGWYLDREGPTIADISIAIGATMLRLANLELDDIPRTRSWLVRMSELPEWGAVQEPFDAWERELRGA